MISVTSCKGVHFSTGGSNIQFFERKRNRFVQCHALPSDKSSLESAMTVSPVTQQTSSEDSALLRYGFVIACLIAAWLIEALLRLQPAAILHSPVIMTGGFYSLQAVYQDVPRMTDAFRTGLRSTASGAHSRSALYGT